MAAGRRCGETHARDPQGRHADVGEATRRGHKRSLALKSVANLGLSGYYFLSSVSGIVAGKQPPASPVLPIPRSHMKITARTIAGLKLPGRKTDAIYFDDERPGLGISLRVSGQQARRSWVAQSRSFGRTRRVLLGSAEVLGAEQARAAAKKVLARVTLGHDPQAEKAARRQTDA